MKSSISLLGTIFRDNNQSLSNARNASLSMKKGGYQFNQDQRSYSNDRHFKPKTLTQLSQNKYLPLHRALHKLNIKTRKIKQYVFVKLINKPRTNSIERTSRSNNQSSQKLYSNYKSILQKFQSNNGISQFQLNQKDPPNLKIESKQSNIQTGIQILAQFWMVRQSKQDSKVNVQVGFKSLKRNQKRRKSVNLLNAIFRKKQKKYYDFFFMRFMKKVEQSLKIDFLMHSLAKLLLKKSFFIIQHTSACEISSSNISQQRSQYASQMRKQKNDHILKQEIPMIVQSQVCLNMNNQKTINNEVLNSNMTSQNSSIKITNFDLGSQNWQEHSYQNDLNNATYFQSETPNKIGSTCYNCTCESLKVNSLSRKGKSKSKITLHSKNTNQKCSIKARTQLQKPQVCFSIYKYGGKIAHLEQPLNPFQLNSHQQGKIKLKSIPAQNLVASLTDINDSKFFIDQFNKKSNPQQKAIKTIQLDSPNFQNLKSQFEMPYQFRSSSPQNKRQNLKTYTHDEGFCGLTTKFYSKQIKLDRNYQTHQNRSDKSRDQFDFGQKKYDSQSKNTGIKQLRPSSSVKNITQSLRQSVAPHYKSRFEQIDSMMKDLQKIKQKSDFNSHYQSIADSLALKDASRQRQQMQNKYIVNLNLKKPKPSRRDIQLSSTSKFNRSHNNSQNQSIFYSDKKSYKNAKPQIGDQQNNIEAKLLALKMQKIQLNQNYTESNCHVLNAPNGDKRKKIIVCRDQKKNSCSTKVFRGFDLTKKIVPNVQVTKNKNSSNILKYVANQNRLY